MAFTHVEIEERKSRTLTLLFVFLAGLYITSIAVLVIGAKFLLTLRWGISGWEVVWIFSLGLAVAAIHWFVSTSRMVDRVLFAIRAQPFEPGDTYHDRLRNIVEEVSVAIGGRYHIEPRVIPTTAMNACAVADFDGRAAIAVTEGLLARLSRSQLESVIGHEAAHIVRGDSLTRTVFCGLFALHEETLKGLVGLLDMESRGERRERAGADIEVDIRFLLLMAFAVVVLWITVGVKKMCEMFISREQEYRADAVAVRLTRDPLSLAEALHLISRRWRGVGTRGESLSTIFILDTGTEMLSEEEGFFAELFSTHPPTARRLEALLGMAHVNPDDFERAMASLETQRRSRQLPEQRPLAATPSRWFVWLDGRWQGPLALDAITSLAGFNPDTWVRGEQDGAVKPASNDPRLLEVLRARYAGDTGGAGSQPAAGDCPNCRVFLTRILYEGVPLDECPACGGCSVTPSQMSRLFARRAYEFSDEIKRLAQAIPAVTSRERVAKQFSLLPMNQLKDRACSACGGPVARQFYTAAYLVEVERCGMCGLTWLDRNERELLQYLYEEAQGADVR